LSARSKRRQNDGEKRNYGGEKPILGNSEIEVNSGWETLFPLKKRALKSIVESVFRRKSFFALYPLKKNSLKKLH